MLVIRHGKRMLDIKETLKIFTLGDTCHMDKHIWIILQK